LMTAITLYRCQQTSISAVDIDGSDKSWQQRTERSEQTGAQPLTMRAPPVSWVTQANVFLRHDIAMQSPNWHFSAVRPTALQPCTSFILTLLYSAVWSFQLRRRGQTWPAWCNGWSSVSPFRLTFLASRCLCHRAV